MYELWKLESRPYPRETKEKEYSVYVTKFGMEQ